MPRPRKPTKVLEFTGAFVKDPQRKKEREGEPVENAPLGAPPTYLAPTETAVWKELQANLVDGVALASDRPAFEMLVRLVGLVRANGLGTLEGAQLTTMTKLFTLFGMTPADRSRVKVPGGKPKKANPFGKLG